MTFGTNYEWVYRNKLGQTVLINSDSLTHRFRMYVTMREDCTTRSDFLEGELTMQENFGSSDSLMKYTHAMRMAACITHQQISSSIKDIVNQ